MSSLITQTGYRNLLLLTAVVSAALSALLIYNNPILNEDSVLYLNTAKAFLEGGLNKAITTYNWPFASILIAGLHHLTGLSLTLSAYLLGGLYYILICCAFVAMVRAAGGNSAVLLFAAYCILFQPTLNEYRHYIIRDHGYWAFVLLGCWALIRFSQELAWRHAFCWLASFVIATLFRFEGMLLLAATPLAILSLSDERKRRIQYVTCIYAGMVLLGALFVIIGSQELTGTRPADELAAIAELPGKITHDFNTLISAITSAEVTKAFADDADAIIKFGLLGLLIYKILLALSPAFIVVWLYNFKLKAGSVDAAYRTAIYCCGAVILCYLATFVSFRHFLSERYVLPVSLLMLTLIPFALVRLLPEVNQSRKYRRSKMVLFLLVLIWPIADTLISTSPSKQYIDDAANWVSTQQQQPLMLTNNEHIAYRYGNNAVVDHDLVSVAGNLRLTTFTADRHYNLLAIKIKKKLTSDAEAVFAKDRLRQIAKFNNEKGDAVYFLAHKNSHISLGQK